MNLSSVTDMKMARACIVNKAKVFYKACLHQPSRLKGTLCIEFNGEEGIDAGAIKYDFFIEYLRSIKQELFEGQANRLVLKHDWGSE